MTCDKCDRPKFSDEHLCDPYDRIVAELEGTPKEPHPLDEMFAAAPELWRRTGVAEPDSKDVPDFRFTVNLLREWRDGDDDVRRALEIAWRAGYASGAGARRTSTECGLEPLSRIVNTDNFAGDYPDETFVLWPMRQDRAQRIADILNEDGGERSRRYFKVEADDYVLVPGFEP